MLAFVIQVQIIKKQPEKNLLQFNIAPWRLLLSTMDTFFFFKQSGYLSLSFVEWLGIVKL